MGRPIFEPLETRTLLSSVQVIVLPGGHAMTASVNAASYAEAGEGAYPPASAPPAHEADSDGDHRVSPAVVFASNSDGLMTLYNGDAPTSPMGWAPMHGEGHGFHEQMNEDDPGYGGGRVMVYMPPATSSTMAIQAEYVTVSPAFLPAPARPVAPPTVAATTMPKQNPPAVTPTDKIARNTMQAGAESINTSVPQLANLVAGQLFAIVPMSLALTASTPHTHVENNLLSATLSTVADFSKAPLVTSLDWEIAAATNTVSASASANFVENLMQSDATALAHVANTVATRLYEENALLWKETAAVIGAALLVGSYFATSRSEPTSPKRSRVNPRHACVGDPPRGVADI